MNIGTLVKSTSGRDKDRYYLIVSIIDERLVLVVDGEIKKLSNPKKKNIKHLSEISILDNIREKLENKKQVFDKEINKAINLYIKSLNNN